jgi:hypothetical protein
MSEKRITESCSKFVLWGFFLLTFTFFAVMTCVNIGWGGDAIPLSAVIQAIEWTRLSSLFSHEYFPVFAVAVVLLSVSGLVASPTTQLALMIAGLVSPILLVDPEMTFFVLLAPFIVLLVLTGSADGEHFVEEMPEGAAVGMLMIMYLGLAICHFLQLRRSRAKEGGNSQFTPSKS